MLCILRGVEAGTLEREANVLKHFWRREGKTSPEIFLERVTTSIKFNSNLKRFPRNPLPVGGEPIVAL